MANSEAPDLDEWVSAAGGYHAIDWTKWAEAMAEYQRRRRVGLASAPTAERKS